jgi:hypothetical protein
MLTACFQHKSQGVFAAPSSAIDPLCMGLYIMHTMSRHLHTILHLLTFTASCKQRGCHGFLCRVADAYDGTVARWRCHLFHLILQSAMHCHATDHSADRDCWSPRGGCWWIWNSSVAGLSPLEALGSAQDRLRRLRLGSRCLGCAIASARAAKHPRRHCLFGSHSHSSPRTCL